MRTLNQEEFNHILQQADIKPRLTRELKFVASTSHLSDDWSSYELIAIADRNGDKGILLLQPDDTLYIASYELSRRIIDSSTGRERAIICDFCYTWQPGSNAASITFTHANTKHKIRFLCCSDLACSQHVRTATKESVVSRAQLREDLSDDDRIARLKTKLVKKVEHLNLAAILL
jgi:hypothetical protein